MSKKNQDKLQKLLSDAAKKQELVNQVAHIIGNVQIATFMVGAYGDDALEVVRYQSAQGLLL